MPSPTELNDIWLFENGRMVERGDSAIITRMLEHELESVRTEDGGWTTIYRHRDTSELWELSCPLSEIHGAGPRRLRLLSRRA
jgi:hypothetical protein